MRKVQKKQEVVISTFIQFGNDQVSSVLWVSMNNPEADFVNSHVQVGVRIQTVDGKTTCSWQKGAVNHRAVQKVYLCGRSSA